ncbi:MAG: efflux RND transporter periplasmic adaptor subunit [Chitinophagaceae bacterium]|nr:efflux transporter periplasmic adaptor subunit [Chitinophagaceae bacterium]HAN37862.1 efflux transporter periplasmic adaptor subunit [Chitinophagaceae bacterium]
MQTIKYIFVAATLATAVACTVTPEQKLAKKKEELTKLKDDRAKLNVEIEKLEKEIVKLDPTQKVEKPKLVSIATVATQPFSHYIDLQGQIVAEDISYVAPRNGQGGYVKAIYVKRGQAIKKGQLVLKLDDAIYQKQIAQIQTQLNLAKDVLRRRENLWKDNIGTEFDLVQARNNVEAVERQMELAKEQLSFTNVYADMDGVVEEITIKVGELFSGTPLAGYVKLVNSSNLKVKVNVPQNYLERVKEGMNITVNVPDAGKTIAAKITLKGQLIDVPSQSFYIEATIPANSGIKANQFASVQILDYSVANAIVVPVNIVQNDEKGKFVMVVAQDGKAQRAKKRVVTTGELYGNNLEIKAGLNSGDIIITEGYQSVYEGQAITTKQ